MIREGLIVLVLTSIVSRQAEADWEKTHWGDSLEKVMQELGGKGTRYSESEEQGKSSSDGGWWCKIGLSNYTFAGFTFAEVSFCFDKSGKLEVINLTTTGDSFQMLDRAVSSELGAPVHVQNGQIPSRTWTDSQKGNTIDLYKVVDETTLRYSPQASGF